MSLKSTHKELLDQLVEETILNAISEDLEITSKSKTNEAIKISNI